MELITVYCIITAVLILAVFFTLTFLDSEVDNRTLATPNIAKDNATFTSFATVRINASANDVWAAVLAFQHYPRWNSVLRKCMWEETTADGAPFVGSKGIIRPALKGLKEHDTRVECTLLDQEHKQLAYRGISIPLFVFNVETVQEIAPVQGEKNVCEFRIWETVGGLLGLPTRYFLKAALDDSMERTADDLKDWVENKKTLRCVSFLDVVQSFDTNLSL